MTRRSAASLAVLVLLLLVVIRTATVHVPNAVVSVRSPTTVTLSGATPSPTWPAAGEAALDVADIGSLGSSGGDEPVPIASLTKVMTAYLTLEKYPLTGDQTGFTLTVTAADARALNADTGEDQSVVAVQAGEQLNERQLLEALLIPSGDNIARMLGAYVAGSDEQFLVEMNNEATQLGMTHTTYTDPSGYESSTVSTAADQIRIFKRAMTFPVFRAIVSMPSATLPVAGTVRNYDPLIADGYEGKTGSDSAAEGCLAFFKYITVGGRRITVVGVVLGQGVGAATSVILGAAGDAAAALVNSVTPDIRPFTVLPAHSTVMVATSADGSHVDARTSRALSVIGWGGIRERLGIHPSVVGKSLLGAATVGRVALGANLLTAEGGTRVTDVHTSGPLGAPGLHWRLQHLL